MPSAEQASQYTATVPAIHPKCLHNGRMRYLTYTLICVVSLGFTACAKQELPKFLTPMPISVPSGQPALGPRIEQGHSRSVILSWMETGDEGKRLRFSTFNQGGWTRPITVVADSNMFVNWADMPSIRSTGEGALLAHWLSYVADAPYAYQVLIARSQDNGKTWSAPQSPHTDGTATEHGFVSGYPASEGTGLVWLDGRETPDQGMTLRSATVAADGTLSSEVLLDDLVCDCCQTDVAMTAAGPIAVYRDRTSEEIRDIYVARQIDGQWQPGKPVSNDGWKIEGCPVNGPSIATLGNSVVIAWFTAANGAPVVKSVYSKDAGRTFSEPNAVATENVIGHVGIAMITKDSYAVSWMESGEQSDYDINIRALTLDGQMDRVRTVGRTSLFHSVPQLLRIDDNLVFAWTDEISDAKKVVSVKVPILGFYD